MTRFARLVLSFTYVLSTIFLSTRALAFELEFVAASPQIYAEPHDLVLSPDRHSLYVADNGNNRIAVLNPISLKFIGSFGEGELGAPHDVVFNESGRLLVADTDNSRIAIYDLNSSPVKLIGEIVGEVRRPEGVEVDANGRVLATGAASGNIVVFKNNAIVAQAGGMSSPHDVVVAPNGTLWIADAGNNRLLNMTPEFKLISIVQGAPYHFKGPRYLDFDREGRLYVADKYANQIKVLAPDNSLLLTLGSGKSGLGPGKFDRPEGIAINGTDVWFSDTYNNRIVRYRIVE